MGRLRYIVFTILFIFAGCTKYDSFPDTPVISYQNYSMYITTDDLGNTVLIIKLNIEFTDGDGDIGLKQTSLPNAPDSLKYNFFLNIYDYKNGNFEKIEDLEGTQNFRVPYIERKGQNKVLKGNIYIDVEYKSIIYDTIFYSFYLVDRKFHKSNVDSSDIIILSGIGL